MIIKVMSRSQIQRYSYQAHLDLTAVISIHDVDKSRPYISTASDGERRNGICDVCECIFDDVVSGEVNCITEADAKKITEFVERVKSSVDQIIVHCEGGVSRSAGVAAAILLYLNGDDSQIFENGNYCPNMTCYRTVLRSFGVFPDQKSTLAKEKRNLALWKQLHY